jgi:hypothetical protein
MTRYVPASKFRRFLLYIGPAVFIELDITRLVDDIEWLAYRRGYTAASNMDYRYYPLDKPDTVAAPGQSYAYVSR